MPIYEYYCPQNNTVYQFLARSLSHRDAVPICPDNPEFHLQKRVSSFAVIGRAKEESDNPLGDINESAMSKLMADFEGDMSVLDQENPDPKLLGNFMRKMTDVMGGKVPPQLQDIVRRLEAGEDPEKFENEFADFDESDPSTDPLFHQVKKIIRNSRQPIRDPKLYELSEWLDTKS